MTRIAGRDRSLVLAVAARVLQYPDEELAPSLPVLYEAVAALAPAARAALARVVDHLGSRPLIELQAQYVATFDLRRRNALYLTYHLNGDTRRRGLAIWRFGELYRTRGCEPASGELGDFLPAILELAAACDPADAGVVDAIAEHLPSVIALRRSLEEDGSPYADAVRAVELALPEPSRSALDAVDRLVAEGPPMESVGLDPYAMPGMEARP